MLPLLNNPWVVGIGGGILSGAIVAWLTHIFLARGENKEYREKIASANRDVIYAIRPGISEGQIPTTAVIEALIHATARRHNVAASNMYGPREIAEELIKEVMDTSFLSSAKKSEYCLQLMPLQEPPRQQLQADLTVKTSDSAEAIAVYRHKNNLRMSVLLGTVTTLMTAMMSIFFTIDRGKDVLENKQFLFIALTASMVLASMLAVYALFMVRERESRRSAAEIEGKTEKVALTLAEIEKKLTKP